MNETKTVSRDGRTMVARYRFPRADATVHESFALFEKQPDAGPGR